MLTRKQRSCFTQAKSLQWNLKSHDMNSKAYERQLFMGRRRESVEKLWICTTQEEKKTRHCSLALQKSREFARDLQTKSKQKSNVSKSRAIKSDREQSQEMKKLARQKEKRVARELARQITCEELAHEKAERKATQQARKAQKAADTAKRRQEVEERHVQRIQ
jgi:colicin import membrane protein